MNLFQILVYLFRGRWPWIYFQGFSSFMELFPKSHQHAFQCVLKMLTRQNEIDKRLWLECKEKIKTLSDGEFEELAEYIQDICTGPRRYSDAQHEVYSRLKHDMVSYQYEKVLRKIRP